MKNSKEYDLHGVKVTIFLDTKKHQWKMCFGLVPSTQKPDMTLTMAKGEAVIQFLDRLTEIQENVAETK